LWSRSHPARWDAVEQSAALKPQRSRSWLKAEPDDPEAFARQVETVCACSLAAPQRFEAEGIPTVSVDEMTGIQALERIAPTPPMKPGQVEHREFESTRQGTQCRLGTFEVTTGPVIAPTVPLRRTAEDFATPIAGTVALDPESGGIVVAENLRTHTSESLVREVAKACAIPTDLGTNGQSGVLKSVATRKAFLTDESPRIRVGSVAKHTSWRNQIEIWFRILVRRVIQRGNFTSTKDLREKMLSFIDYFNRALAKPFQWTFTGRALNV
jgi:hypothetical protein